VFAKVLVANRGEIAIRIFRTLRDLGVASVAVYSDADRDAPFVRYADEAYRIGAGPATESYLRGETIVRTALRAGAEAIHPGFGFLAENADFARACAAAGLVFVGPPPDAIEIMGSKVRAREAMRAAGVPVIPGATEPVPDLAAASRVAGEIGYPVAVKASAGGGGKGIRVAGAPDELAAAFETARREGRAYFADDTVYVERYLERPRHVEVQVLADAHGAVIHLGERDCTIQRRHQKLVEETPSPAVDAALRDRIGAIGVTAARAVDYTNAGTVEGLLAGDGTYYFLEMNTRLQVEHTVTEMVTGLDLVREQLRLAAGEPLGLRQSDVVLRGHAIQCRINAEDAARGFAPVPGRIVHYREPAGPGVRVDSGVTAGSSVSELYDPMIAKLITWDADREGARRRMLRALSEFEITGVATLVSFHRALLRHPGFAAGEGLHDVVEGGLDLAAEPAAPEAAPAGGDGALPAAAGEPESLTVEVDGKRFDVTVVVPEPPGRTRLLARRESLARRGGAGAGAHDVIASPMQGTVLRVGANAGAAVRAGDVLVVIEAMKMENEIVAPHDGVVERVDVDVGQAVRAGDALLELAGTGD
jgi:acetyl-CoA/propionyl-CoA carboxylase biotin carboxyl carrier protein